MEQKTTQFKRSVKGTLQAGLSSVLGGKGKTYFIVEFLFNSNTHHQGQEQQVIVDEAFIGRDPDCQIHIDEEFGTVSRKHAMIKRVGENWILVHHSQTNATYVNSQQVMAEQVLQNGDEIQLSYGGPRIRFIIPQGEKAFTSSIGLSQRFNLFRQQALRPYRTALILITLIFLLAIAGLVYFWKVSSEGYQKQLDENGQVIESLQDEQQTLKEKIRRLVSGSGKSTKTGTGKNEVTGVNVNNSVLDSFMDDVYFIRLTKVTVSADPDSYCQTVMNHNGIDGRVWTYEISEKQNNDYALSGTGFITSDGFFVTARNVIEPWAYIDCLDRENPIFWAAHFVWAGGTIDATYHIESRTGDRKNLTFREFSVSKHSEEEVEFTATDDDAYHVRRSMAKNDYAYLRLPVKSNLVVNRDFSTKVPSGTRLDILGFPNAMGADKNYIKPQYTFATTSNDGLYHGQIPVTGASFEAGNAGGPVFCEKDGQYYVVGIVSRGLGRHGGIIVPMSKINF